MKIEFLGTGTSQGVPVIACGCKVCRSEDPKDQRLRSSVMVEVDGIHLVIDTGPDFRQQMLKSGAKQLDAVLFTHGHKDHTAGFDDIRAFNYIQQQAMDVYVDENVEEVLRRDFFYCFSDFKYPGIPELNLHNFSNAPFVVKGVKVTPVKVLHYKLPVFGFRIGDFTYITDANFISEEEKQKIKGSKVLVLNALRREKHISHFTLSEAVELAQEIGAEQTYLTHFSHQMGLYKDLKEELPEGIYPAYDGLKVEI